MLTWLLTRLRQLLGWVRRTLHAFRILFLPAALSLFAVAILAMPAQTLDYYKALAETYAAEPSFFWQEISIAAVFLVGVSISLFVAARVAETLARERRDPGLTRPLLGWSVFFAVLPLFGLMYGLHRAADLRLPFTKNSYLREISAIDPDSAAALGLLFDWREVFQYLNYAAAIVVLVIAALIALAFRARSCTIGDSFRNFTMRRASILISLFCLAFLIGIFLFSPVVLPQAIGAISIFALFVIVVALLSAQLLVWGLQYDVPFLAILIAASLIFSWLNLNDNHELQRIDATGARVQGNSAHYARTSDLPSLESQFLAWYNARPDKNDSAYAYQGYPVYIVAAQGGGIYAAAHSLLFMTRMQRTCEKFSQHLFAISAVSGGSVGAALFSSLASTFENNATVCPPLTESLEGGQKRLVRPPITEKTRQQYETAYQLASEDYLSPLLAGALFPDFAQQFIWRPIPALSRARSLEKGLERSWDKASSQYPLVRQDRNPLEQGILNSWQPDKARPALVLNTTEIGSGRRRIIAPFYFEPNRRSDLSLVPLSRDYDVSLSAAAVASARFPWLTPAAWLQTDNPNDPIATATRTIRIADGGYFDNSGILTALDLIDKLENIAQTQTPPLNVRFLLLAMSSGAYPDDTFLGLGEALSPIQALLNARQSQTYNT